jgi:protein-S-isoprenylcysteine O-methyltransferase Ste14
MLWRAIVAFLALPGVVAFALPLALIRSRGAVADIRPIGLVPLALGACLLLWCVREFYVAGRGTLAPWAPPVHLVESGPYRHSRNPMYVAVALILAGWATLYASGVLLAYGLVVVVAFRLRVVRGEEPVLARSFADDWRRYCARTPRWF